MIIKNNVELDKFRKKIADSFLFTVNLYDFYERSHEVDEFSLTLCEFVMKINTEEAFAEKIMGRCVSVV